LVSGSVILMAGVFYLDSLRLPFAAARLPRILCGALVILAIVVMVEALVARRRSARGQPAQAAGSGRRLLEPFFQGVRLGPLCGFASAILASAALMPILGYFVVTPVFLLGSLLAFRACRWPAAIAIGALFPLFVYLVFVAFLNAQLPLGVYLE
jgi:hypothetical protein